MYTARVHPVYCPGSPCMLSRFLLHTVQVTPEYCAGSPCILSRFLLCPVRVFPVNCPGSAWILSGFCLDTVRVPHGYSPGSPWILSGFTLYSLRVPPVYCPGSPCILSKSIQINLPNPILLSHFRANISTFYSSSCFSSCYSRYNLIMHHNYTLNSICYQKKSNKHDLRHSVNSRNFTELLCRIKSLSGAVSFVSTYHYSYILLIAIPLFHLRLVHE